MQINQILAPIHTLGPGKRVGLWTQGCSKGCRGCISPEMQSSKIGETLDINALVDILIDAAAKTESNGLTISGGDPFEQAEELYKLLKRVRSIFNDVLVYTGYAYDDIINNAAGDYGVLCLDMIDVLIDGQYIESQNIGNIPLRGSDNQKIIYLNSEKEAIYSEYMKSGRTIEPFFIKDHIIFVGIPERE